MFALINSNTGITTMAFPTREEAEVELALQQAEFSGTRLFIREVAESPMYSVIQPENHFIVGRTRDLAVAEQLRAEKSQSAAFAPAYIENETTGERVDTFTVREVASRRVVQVAESLDDACTVKGLHTYWENVDCEIIDNRTGQVARTL